MPYAQTVTDLRGVINTFLRQVVGHDRVYYASTNFSKPKQQYFTYRFLTMTPIESAGHVGHDMMDREITYLHYRVAVDFWCYKDSSGASPVSTPMDALMNVRHALSKREVVYNNFTLNKIAYQTSSTISDRTVPLDGAQFEQRSTFTAFFHMVIEQSDLSSDGAIETVNLTETLNEESTEIIQTDTVMEPSP